MMSHERETLLKKADELDKNGNDKQAAEIYLSLLKDDPDNVSLLVKSASSIFFGDDWGAYEGKTEKNIGKMFELLNKAVRLEPNNPDIRSSLVTYLMLYGNGDTDYAIAAAKEIRQILETKPDHLDTLLRLSRDYHLVKAGMTVDEAMVLFERSVACSEDNYELWESYGEFLESFVAPRHWTKNVDKMASGYKYIKQMLSAYENMKAKMSSEEYNRRKKYVDGRLVMCRQMLSRIDKYKKALQKKIDKAKNSPDPEERPFLDFLEFNILDNQLYEPESSYLIYSETKGDLGASPDSILKGMVNLVRLGFSQAYDINSNPYKKVTLKDVRKDLGGRTDKWLLTQYYHSEYYFEVTKKGRTELSKKVYDTYGKLSNVFNDLL